MQRVLHRNNTIVITWGIILIWFSASPYQTIFPVLTDIQVPLGFFCLMLLLLRHRGGYTLNLYSSSIVIIVLMIVCTFLVHTMELPSNYMRQMLWWIIAYCITQQISFEQFKKLYQKVMTFVVITSLIGYSINNTTSLLNILPQMQNINGITYSIGIIFNSLSGIPDRNCGIFWEPGIYASFLTIAIILELCFSDAKVSKWRIFLYWITILTTRSSAGYVLMILVVLLLCVYSIHGKTSIIKTLIGTVAIVAVCILLWNLDAIILQSQVLSDNIYMTKLLTSNFSQSARMNAILHNLEVFASEPVFGAGLATVGERISKANFADISTSTYLLSIYGIPGIMFSLYWVIGIVKRKNIGLYAKMVILIIIFVILNKETHIQILFTWCLMFYLLKDASERKYPASIPKGGMISVRKDSE